MDPYISIAFLGDEEEGRVTFTPTEADLTVGTLRVTGTGRFRSAFDRAIDTPGVRSCGQWSFDAPLQRNRWDHVQVAKSAVSESYEWTLTWTFEGVPEPEDLPPDAIA